MTNMANLMKQAQQLQAKMAEMEKSIESMEITGESGAGMVKVTLNGQSKLLSIKIDPSIVDPTDTEMLEDLIKAAFNDGALKIASAVENQRKSLAGQIPLPAGMKFPF